LRVLLDTHVFLWLLSEPERLGDRVDEVEDARTELLFSAASSWEIAIKHGLGRLALPESPQRYVPARMRVLGVIGIPVDHTHALAVSGLPPIHRDPFDRLLVAQAQALDVPLWTADETVASYPVDTVLVGA
jgi:PIN domain nuclease of toxin-antitoxin system